MESDGAERLLPNDTNSVYYIISVIAALFIVAGSISGVILNIFHLIVLTRKSMRISSVSSIMIGIAICDLICTVEVLIMFASESDPYGSDCTPPYSITRMHFNLISESIYNGARQCSAWLGLLVATIRYRIVSNKTQQSNRVSSPKYGSRSCFIMLLPSLLISVSYYFKFQFVRNGEWKAVDSCDEPSEMIEPIWRMQYHWFLELNDGFWERVFHFVIGMICKIIPCLILPIITRLLIREMKVPRVIVASLSSSSFRSYRRTQKDRTTILVILVAITFLMSEFPVGVIEMIQVVVHDYSRLQNLIITTTYVCEAVFISSASIHCVIHFAMSAQYRRTVLDLIPMICWKKFKKTTNLAAPAETIRSSLSKIDQK